MYYTYISSCLESFGLGSLLISNWISTATSVPVVTYMFSLLFRKVIIPLSSWFHHMFDDDDEPTKGGDRIMRLNNKQKIILGGYRNYEKIRDDGLLEFKKSFEIFKNLTKKIKIDGRKKHLHLLKLKKILTIFK